MLDAPVDDGNDRTLKVNFAENSLFLEEHWKDRDRDPCIVVSPQVTKKTCDRHLRLLHDICLYAVYSLVRTSRPYILTLLT